MGNSARVMVGLGEILWDMLPAGRQLGGAPANFAYHAHALGAEGVVVSQVGADEPGRDILKKLDDLGLSRSSVAIDADHPTGIVDVTVDSLGVPCYVIRTGVAWDFLQFDAGTLELAARADAVCFGTLGQRSVTSRDSIAAFLGVTRPDCLRVFDINLRQNFFTRELIVDMLGIASVLKINDQELPVLAEVLGIKRSTPSAIFRAMIKDYPLKLMALTRGSSGSLLIPRRGEADDHPGFATEEVADTVGAGDAFTAAMVLGLLDEYPLQRINAFANRLAAFVCSRPGATPVIPESLRGTR